MGNQDYFVSNHEELGHTPLDKCSWKTPDSCWNKVDGWTTKNGMREMHHFGFHWLMDEGTAVVRRIPCLCGHYKLELDKEWDFAGLEDDNVHKPEPQDKCKNAPNCRELVSRCKKKERRKDGRQRRSLHHIGR